MNLEHPRYLAGSGPLLEQAPGEHYLVGGQLGWATEAYATPHRRRAARSGALLDQRPLELGNAGKHGQHHASGRAGRVGPGLAQERRPAPVSRSCSAIPAGLWSSALGGRGGRPRPRPARAHGRAGGELRPVAPGARELLFVDTPATGLLQRGALRHDQGLSVCQPPFRSRDPLPWPGKLAGLRPRARGQRLRRALHPGAEGEPSCGSAASTPSKSCAWHSSGSGRPTTRPGSSSATATGHQPRSEPIRSLAWPWPHRCRSVSQNRGPVQREHHPPGRTGRVGPGLAQGT